MNTTSCEWKGIWVVAEQQSGCLHSVTYELLGKAKSLRSQMAEPEPVSVILTGHNIAGLAAELANHGADQVIVYDHPELEIFHNDFYNAILTEAVREHRPSIMLFPATATGSNLSAMLGVSLHTGVAAHCVDVRIDGGSNLVAVVPAFGGKVLGEIFCRISRPQIATVKPGIFAKAVNDCERVCKIIKYNPQAILEKQPKRLENLGLHQQELKGLNLADADVIVSGGWGLETADNWKLLEELAALLAGAVGCTRPPVDEGWVAGEQQMVGTSGKSVRPKLYLGVGISGATHHVCGMKDSGVVISINKDPQAPIFDVSDIKVVADAKVILPLLISEIKKIKSTGER